MMSLRHLLGVATDVTVMGFARLLPINLLEKIGGYLGRRESHRSKKERRYEMELVGRILFPTLDDDAQSAKIDRNWAFIGESMLKVANLPRIARQQSVSVTGMEAIAQRRDNGQPTIIAFVHLGFWELACVNLARLELEPMSIYQAPANPLRAKIAKRTRVEAYMALRPDTPDDTLRQHFQDHVIEGSPRATRKILKGLKNGGLAWFAVDECIDGHVHGPWFGKHWRRSGNLEMIARFAQKTNAAIVPTWCLKTEDGYAITYSEPIEVDGKAVEELTHLVTRRLAPLVEEHHEQWFMYHELRAADFGNSGA